MLDFFRRQGQTEMIQEVVNLGIIVDFQKTLKAYENKKDDELKIIFAGLLLNSLKRKV